ncbi:MAG: redoxin family protein [Planctomycetota bacterium]|nr:redoxin family protein [Planctomycetota bacterium]
MKLTGGYVVRVVALAATFLMGVESVVASSTMQEPIEATALPSGPVDPELTDSRWLRRTVSEFAGSRATVLFFSSVDCPIVKRYLPRIEEMAKAHDPAEVRFLVVNVAAGDSLVDAAGQQVLLAPSTTFAKDFDGSLVSRLGVERTAAVVVLDGEQRLVYRGRVDRQYRYTGTAPNAGRADLALAIEDVLAGRAVQVATTPVDGCRITRARPIDPTATPPDYQRDIEPLFRKHCQDCHRPGGEGPFVLPDLAQARTNLEMIGEVVAEQRMPPWYGSRRYGHFINERGMSAEERATVAAWVRAGGPGKEAEDRVPVAPAPKWRIGEPDLVLKVPVPIRLPADGFLPYRYYILPYRFEQDTWLEAIEIRSDDGRVLHHCNMARVKWGERFSPRGFVTGQVPGGDAMILDEGLAVRVTKGSALALQAHYVTVGEPVVDRLSVGLRFARGTVQKELRIQAMADSRFAIAPGAVAYPVSSRRRFPKDARLFGLVPHMHLRGRDIVVRALPPEGAPETLLVVPNYNFDWQQSYQWGREGRPIAAGTRLEAIAHFDNSPSNPFNPDPGKVVRYGLQTVDEMMFAFAFYVLEDEELGLRVDPKTGHALE